MRHHVLRLVPLVFVLGLEIGAHAQETVNPSLRGWRCKSTIKGACEQGVYNDIELLTRRVYEENRQNSAGKASGGLALKSFRIGEFSATAYLEGDVTSDPPYRSQLLELTFFPGQDIQGSGVPGLGQRRFTLGDRYPNFAGPFLWESNQTLGNSVKEVVSQDLRSAFEKAVRQTQGLATGTSTLPGATPQSCWRGCGDKSEEKRFREIAQLTKSLFVDSRGIEVSSKQAFKCSLYYPVGTKEVAFNHFDANGNKEIEVSIDYRARMRMSSFEIFTDSAQAVLEGQIVVNGDVQPVVYSVSFPIGDGIERTGIAGLGTPWMPVGGPDSSTFWENGVFFFDFYNNVPIHRSEIRWGKYPSEYHCYYPELVPTFGPLDNPAEYDKVLLRNKKSLRKNLRPLMDAMNERIVNAFAFAVKVHTGVGTLTTQEVARYRSSYFDDELASQSQDLKGALASLDQAKVRLSTSRTVYAPLLADAESVLSNKDATAEQVLSLRDRSLRAIDGACAEDSKVLSRALDEVLQKYEKFLIFKDNSLVLFQTAGLAGTHESLFNAAAPSNEAIETKLGEAEALLSANSPCKKISEILTGIFLTIEKAKLNGINSSLQGISDSISAALGEKAALYERVSLRTAMTTLVEQEAFKLNLAIASVSLSSGLASTEALTRIKNEELLPRIEGSKILTEAQKLSLSQEVDLRIQTAIKTWDDFIQMAGGDRALVDLRYNYMYLDQAKGFRSRLLELGDVEQKMLLVNWFNTLKNLGYEKPSSCLDPSVALQAAEPCWTLDLPQSDSLLGEFDQVQQSLLLLMQQTTQP